MRAALKPQWPLSNYSRHIKYGGINWHVQQLGEEGPVILLLHGTGASTHSWRDVATDLSTDYRVLMFDLPGHAFTDQPVNRKMSLPGMSRLIAGLLTHLDITPDIMVGHSAGAALCCQMVQSDLVEAKRIISFNGALQPFDGVAGHLFTPVAQLMALNPLIPRLVSWRARRGELTKKLVNDTGSTLTEEGIDYYAQLLAMPKHIKGALTMMAHWSLDSLSRQLPQLAIPLHLIVGTNDRTVPPKQGENVSQVVETATLTRLPSLGHLAHEEAPELVCQTIRSLIASPAQIDTPAVHQQGIA